jgi:hypothetical protein
MGGWNFRKNFVPCTLTIVADGTKAFSKAEQVYL